MIRKPGSSEDVEQFWKNIEIELGENVWASALCEHLSGWSIPQAGRWLILFVTASGVHFHRPARDNLIGRAFGMSSDADKEMKYHIPSEQLLAVETAAKRRSGERRWPRLVSRDPGVKVRYRDEHGNDREVVFRFETNRKKIVAALEQIAHISE